MQLSLVILVLLAAAIFLGTRFINANPQTLAKRARLVMGAASLFGALILTIRGALPLAAPLAIFGFFVLATDKPLRFAPRWASKRPGKRSRVVTRCLAMELDHDSGEMDGEVLNGPFAGQHLSGLSIESLLKLREACLAAGDQSAALLDAYLDRLHGGWREAAHGHTATPPDAAMTPNEALEILGLQPGADPKQVHDAHRRMMKQFHPDHGGSDYLASKINQAKDLLLRGER